MLGNSKSEKFELERVEVPVVHQINKRQVICICVVVVLVVAAAAFSVGHFVTSPLSVKADKKHTWHGLSSQFHDKFQTSVDSRKIEENLRFFTSKPHIAGDRRQKELAELLQAQWKSYGFDSVEMPEYEVLLSMPQVDHPNKVEIVQNGTVVYETAGQYNTTAGPTDKQPFLYTPYFPYSGNGTAEGELVFANHCQDNDFTELANLTITVKGKIVICKSIGSSVLRAAMYGAIAVLLYPDPEITSKLGTRPQDTFPNTPWNPADAVFEKPLRYIFGDPLTPHFPSIPGMYRRPLNESKLPSIPAQPISFEEAKHILSRMKGEEVPSSWKGALNITYRLGPGFESPNTTVRLTINNQVNVQPIYNVIGTITGSNEPDRYVLIGNHRDAFLYGAVDPSSGTATLAEMARVMGNLLKSGYRPRRTIKFCSWGAEEFGLIGSVEWVEEHSKILSDRAIVYLNTDVAVGGNFVLVAQSCPSFAKFIFSWAKKIPDPNAQNGKTSMYDIMVERTPSKTYKGKPQVVPYLYMSDYIPFYNSIGVPSADFSYFFGHNNKMELYPVYHTQHDNFYWMKTFVDPKFEFHKTMAMFQGGMLLELADMDVLPFDFARTAESLERLFPLLSAYKSTGMKVDPIVKAIVKFKNASKSFVEAKAQLTGKEDPIYLRMVNDQMLQAEKAFVRADTYSSDSITKNVVSPRGYFPGIHEANLLAKRTHNYEELKKQLSVVTAAINSAADFLKPFPPPGTSDAHTVSVPGKMIVLLAVGLQVLLFHR
ncbi:putative N-acetylated-alpha-linked acidic dipeptidase isoform X1 [Nematostella vectensis]|uniref:putative N-acetylated-alpha-linked acidic dipeptidase isoform X1 n=1 Tax=Nematostella vectensis TaxID=45351 RepID=UPI0020770356|nr:putative N-acetylated-alpha-linked acidic dipeptidase isoform X1 [Nematostella vectensis]